MTNGKDRTYKVIPWLEHGIQDRGRVATFFICWSKTRDDTKELLRTQNTILS